MIDYVTYFFLVPVGFILFFIGIYDHLRGPEKISPFLESNNNRLWYGKMLVILGIYFVIFFSNKFMNH